MATSPEPLWPGQDRDTLPTLHTLPAEGVADDAPVVLVLPGGGYQHLADHEAEPIAWFFHGFGFHSAVLRYRLAPDAHHPAMLHDAQRAIRLLRQRGHAKVAVLGFSAGGHLASTAAVHHARFADPDDPLTDKFSARPDAVVLCYPVIHLTGQYAHLGSMRSLLGEDPDPGLREMLTTSDHIDRDTPPAFLWTTTEDKAVPAENAIDFAMGCRRMGVPFELHVYEAGGHGLGLPEDNPVIRTWAPLAGHFLRRHLLGE